MLRRVKLYINGRKPSEIESLQSDNIDELFIRG